jgi:AcrR family transcriptional regulator
MHPAANPASNFASEASADAALPPRERILAAAGRLFYAQGFHSTGIDLIIAEASVAKMSLYQHFRSKDELIAAFLLRRDEFWCGWLQARVDVLGGTPRARLLAVFDALGEWFTSDDFRGCAFINAAAEFTDAKHSARIISLQHKERVHAYLKALAEAARMSRPAELAAQLALLVEGAIVTAQVGPGSEALSAATRAKTIARRILTDFQPAKDKTT